MTKDIYSRLDGTRRPLLKGHWHHAHDTERGRVEGKLCTEASKRGKRNEPEDCYVREADFLFYIANLSMGASAV